MSFQRTIRRLVLAASAPLLLSAPLAAQVQNGPQAPPKAPAIIRLPTKPAPDAAPVPPDEIIRRFAALEDEFARVRPGYTYRKSVRLDEIGPDGKPSGSSEIITEYEVAPDGAIRGKAAKKPGSTLHVTELEPDALEMLAGIPSFPLGTAQLSKYDIVYQTAESVDELNTYVFRVTPKQVDRKQAYFSGLVWVDDHDLAIVKSYGKWVLETGDLTPPQLPFTMFETYRQPVANKYWMPAYSRSDSSMSTKSGSVPVRLIIRWDNYKAIAPENPAAQPAPQPAASPSQPSR